MSNLAGWVTATGKAGASTWDSSLEAEEVVGLGMGDNTGERADGLGPEGWGSRVTGDCVEAKRKN